VAADLDRLRGPIGLDLGGRLPGETALAILAEVVAERRGGAGRPMRDLAREREREAAAS
jgi:xanthine dehydrogenase accessory factor